MAFIEIRGKKEEDHFIPRDADFVITTRGKGYIEEVAKGKATGSIGVNLDAGKYRVKVWSRDADIMWLEDFTVGTKEEAEKFRNAKSMWSRPIATSQGARWNCTMPGCRHSATSEIGAYFHEWRDHFKVDPLKAGPEEMEKAKVSGPAR